MVIATPVIACIKVLLKFINKNLHITEKIIEMNEEMEN
jgi:hypothetical protein